MEALLAFELEKKQNAKTHVIQSCHPMVLNTSQNVFRCCAQVKVCLPNFLWLCFMLNSLVVTWLAFLLGLHGAALRMALPPPPIMAPLLPLGSS